MVKVYQDSPRHPILRLTGYFVQRFSQVAFLLIAAPSSESHFWEQTCPGVLCASP